MPINHVHLAIAEGCFAYCKTPFCSAAWQLLVTGRGIQKCCDAAMACGEEQWGSQELLDSLVPSCSCYHGTACPVVPAYLFRLRFFLLLLQAPCS